MPTILVTEPLWRVSHLPGDSNGHQLLPPLLRRRAVCGSIAEGMVSSTHLMLFGQPLENLAVVSRFLFLLRVMYGFCLDRFFAFCFDLCHQTLRFVFHVEGVS